MPPAINLKNVTNNVGWSVLSKTTTFGLKFVTVPILARMVSREVLLDRIRDDLPSEGFCKW
jgi:succinoglycan exporter